MEIGSPPRAAVTHIRRRAISRRLGCAYTAGAPSPTGQANSALLQPSSCVSGFLAPSVRPLESQVRGGGGCIVLRACTASCTAHESERVEARLSRPTSGCSAMRSRRSWRCGSRHGHLDDGVAAARGPTLMELCARSPTAHAPRMHSDDDGCAQCCGGCVSEGRGSWKGRMHRPGKRARTRA